MRLADLDTCGAVPPAKLAFALLLLLLLLLLLPLLLPLFCCVPAGDCCHASG
jgi:hypothetical protein